MVLDIDWTRIFDEVYSASGSTEAEIAQFIAAIGQPITAEEIEQANASQSNPFHKNDPLYSKWQPIDSARWTIPNRPIPSAYLSLIRWCNRGDAQTGERYFQFFSMMDPGHGVRAMLLAYQLPEYMPGALPIAFNGGGVFYILDMRQPAMNDEYPIVCSHAVNLGWRPDQHCVVADSLVEACRGTINVEDLMEAKWRDR